MSLATATAVVVANMVGTGVFTSLGFQVGGLPTGFALLSLWAVGGVCALCGALVYGELAAALPRSGGEYHFLSQTLHPAVGFSAGWLAMTVGFAAPIALAAMAFGRYFSSLVPGTQAVVLSLGVAAAVTGVQLRGGVFAARFQNVATWLKVALILAFIAAGAWFGPGQPLSFGPVPGDAGRLISAPFAVNLVYVMYAYAGWNAATYIVGEVRQPRRNVPLAVVLGTLLVALLYVALNAVFLHVVPLAELEGRLEVGHLASERIFGTAGGRVMSGLICLGLVSSISAMTWVGPRVAQTMGQDVRLLAPLARCSARGVPTLALWLQFAVVAVLLLTASFEAVLTYVQFSIQLCSFLTVVGMMWLRHRRPDLPRPVRCWGYPVTPLVFLAISLWMLAYLVLDRPLESLAGLATLASGLLVYGLDRRRHRIRAG